MLHFVAFFHIASLLSTGVDNKKVQVDNEKSYRADKQHRFPIGVDIEKALELDNIVFFTFLSDFNIEISSKNVTKHPVA